MVIHRDIQDALLSAAKKRHRDTARRRDVQANALGADEYHRYQTLLNNSKFIQPIDADTTKANIYYIKKRFSRYVYIFSQPRLFMLTYTRFCAKMRLGPWGLAIRPHICDKGFIMSFLHWICETYLQPRRKRSKKKTVNQYWRDFKMLYRRVNDGQVVNPNDCEEIRKVIKSVFDSLQDLF